MAGFQVKRFEILPLISPTRNINIAYSTSVNGQAYYTQGEKSRICIPHTTLLKSEPWILAIKKDDDAKNSKPITSWLAEWASEIYFKLNTWKIELQITEAYLKEFVAQSPHMDPEIPPQFEKKLIFFEL